MKNVLMAVMALVVIGMFAQEVSATRPGRVAVGVGGGRANVVVQNRGVLGFGRQRVIVNNGFGRTNVIVKRGFGRQQVIVGGGFGRQADRQR